MASCVQISSAIRAFYHVWKWHNVQQEIGDAPLYNSYSLPNQVMITGPLPALSKCKSRRFNTWGHSSMHRTTLWRWWSGSPRLRTPPGRPGLRSSSKKVQAIIDETPQWCGDPLVQSGGRWQTLGVAVGLGAGPQVQRDPGLASEGELRICTLLSLAPSSPTWTRWTTSFRHMLRKSPTWPPATPKPAWSPSSTEYSPSSCRCLWKKHAPSSRSGSRWWLRLKAATLNRCHLYKIITLPELIFAIKVCFLLDENFIVPPCTFEPSACHNSVTLLSLPSKEE